MALKILVLLEEADFLKGPIFYFYFLNIQQPRNTKNLMAMLSGDYEGTENLVT